MGKINDTVFSIIVPIRIESPQFEIYLTNFKYCAENLTKIQPVTVYDKTFTKEIIVSNYGSLDQYTTRIEETCKRHGFKYVYTNAEKWSRSKALNRGIGNATGCRLYIIDADAILPEDYFYHHLLNAHRGIYTVSLVYDSFERTNKSSNAADLRKLPGAIRIPGWSHIGVSHQWILDNGAYNEEYEGWGGEDDELIAHMHHNGLKRKKIDINPVHLWHPTYDALMTSIGKQKEYITDRETNRHRYWKFLDKIKQK